MQVVTGPNQRPIKLWTDGVPVEHAVMRQAQLLAELPFVHQHVAMMPDCHVGTGGAVGTVLPTLHAIVPAAVGVDLGCGMMATRLDLTANDLPDALEEVRAQIESLIPVGRTADGRPSADKGAWVGGDNIPTAVVARWRTELEEPFKRIVEHHPKVGQSNNLTHLGTLGSGNHFIELCLDETDRVWLMLHSGSRGVGNRIGTYFIERAKEHMRRNFIKLPDENLAYLPEGPGDFYDYIKAVMWAQDFARINRELMMNIAIKAVTLALGRPLGGLGQEVVQCHHNYVATERHFGQKVWVTRKGAIRAGKDELGIIPGSMGTKSYIVRGLGNRESFESCSHGAGRRMSRSAAKKAFTVEDHIAATAGVECRKDAGVLDETPGAYKNLDDVMAAQADLVEVVHTLRAVVCVKG